jgi:hypothetical protein
VSAFNSVEIEREALPEGYTGLAGFHKYWGKKPLECLSFLIETLTTTDEIVIDPFVGSGLIGRETLARGRRFIGIDVNPMAIELSTLLASAPCVIKLSDALNDIEKRTAAKIHQSYRMENGDIATHYLWDRDALRSVWRSGKGRTRRQEFSPTGHDQALFESYKGYEFQYPRPLKQFHNSRINTSAELSLSDLFTGRARRNIDMLLEAIDRQEEAVKRALRLSLTSASGQMSNMVFAITGRGKTTGKTSEKIEVGSWVIGYWRPALHFEINVWNCFQKRAWQLLRAISKLESLDGADFSSSAVDVAGGHARIALEQGNANEVLARLPPDSASLIITDPPHGDRIPYLELSEMWNSLLGWTADFENEIVVSNARGRRKTKDVYSEEMKLFLERAARVLKPDRYLALLFNARDDDSWEFLRETPASSKLVFQGCFPLTYTANSVVQDARKGGLKNDYVLLYQKRIHGEDAAFAGALHMMTGWATEFPRTPIIKNGD